MRNRKPAAAAAGVKKRAKKLPGSYSNQTLAAQQLARSECRDRLQRAVDWCRDKPTTAAEHGKH